MISPQIFWEWVTEWSTSNVNKTRENVLLLIYTPYIYHMFIFELFKNKSQLTGSHEENQGCRELQWS